MPAASRSQTARIAVLFMHPACNMSCDFCITEDGFDAIRPQQALELFRSLREQGFDSVVLGGGEPFSWPGDLRRLAEEAHSLGLLVQVGTNGIAMPTGEEQLRSFDRFVLPLDSSEAELHDSLRELKGSHHQLILDRLELLREVGVKLTISTVVNRRNAHQLGAICDLLLERAQRGLRIHAWHLYQFLPHGRGGSLHADELAIDEGAYHRACQQVRSRKLPFKVYKRRDMMFSDTVDFFWSEGGAIRSGREAWARG